MSRHPLVRRQHGNAATDKSDDLPPTPAQDIRRRGPWPQGISANQPPSSPSLPPRSPATRADLAIRVSPGLQDCCSISHVNRNLALALYRMGYDVSFQPDSITKVACPSYVGQTAHLLRRPNAPHVNLCWAAHLPQALPEERGKLLIATSDHGTIYDERVVKMMTTDDISMVLALSPGCADAIAKNVPREKIALLPLGVDTEIYRPDGPAFAHWDKVEWLGEEADPGAFTFLVAGYMQPRKGFVEAVEAFCCAFEGRRDVRLVVKAVAERHGVRGQEAVAAVAAKHGFPPIGYMETVLSEYELAALYREADCLVNTHHREGFGLPPLEAMACATPALVTDFHGPQQYAREGNAYLLSPGQIALEKTRGPDQVNRIEWAYYDMEELVALMRTVEGREGREEIVAAGLAEVQGWTWQRSACAVTEIMEENMGTPKCLPRKWVSPKVDFSLVVCVRNGVEKLTRMLATMLPVTEARCEVIVLDDASGEDEAKRLAALCAKYPIIRLLRSDVQLGIAGARSRLFEETRGEFVCSMDADLDFSQTGDGWLTKLREVWMGEDGKAGVIAPLLLWPNGTVQAAGAKVDTAQPLSFQLRCYEEKPGKFAKTPAYVSSVSGAVHFFRHDLLNVVQVETGYFPCWYEDTDTCFQARAAGFLIRHSPEVTVIHDANTWCLSDEGVRQARVNDMRALFHGRWEDLLEETAARQDDTGALGYPAQTGKRGAKK